MKNRKIIKIVFLVIFVIFIIVLALFLINNSAKKNNNKKNPINNEENEHIINLENTECTEKISWNGIFKNNNSTLKLYQKSDTEASLTITGDFYYNSIIKIENNQIDYEETIDGYTQKIKININDNIMLLEMSDTYPGNTLHQVNGTYTKESNYTIDQIILDNYNSKNSK